MTRLGRLAGSLPLLLLCAQAPQTGVPEGVGPAGIGPAGVVPAGVPVQVVVHGLRSDRGHLMVAVCTRETFLGDHCPYVARVSARPGSVTATVPSVPPGVYAVEVWHDENDNERIDRSFLGIPVEGIGFSRNVRFHFGPPRFDDAAVAIGPRGADLEVTLLFFD